MRALFHLQRVVWSLLLALVLTAEVFGQTRGNNLCLITWNIQHLGGTKDDAEIRDMAHLIKRADIIAIQEVVAKDPAGAQAVARLVDALDRTGADYDYVVSNPTRSPSAHISERYVFIWRTDRVSLKGRPRLLAEYEDRMDREPYLATFRWGSSDMHVVTLHARPHDKQPEQEIAALRQLPEKLSDAPLIVAGDFNLVSHHTVFNPWLKRGYEQAVRQQKTTLKSKCELPCDDFYSREKDNILLPITHFERIEGGVIQVPEWYRGDLEKARNLSDHVPVYVIFSRQPQ